MKDVTASYIAKEEAVQRIPSEIYHVYNSYIDYYYSDGDVSITVSGIEYSPSTITRGEITFNIELEVSQVEITGVYLAEPIIEYIVMNPLEIIFISIMKVHREQSPIEQSVIFIGQIKSVEFKGNEAKVTVVSFEHYLMQPLPKYRYQPICNNFLYDDYCTIDKDTYKESTTVTAISTDLLTLTLNSITSTTDYFKHGYVETEDHEKRMITAHTGLSITIRYKISGLEVGDAIDVYPGCDLNIETCRDKFNNVVSFFGHVYIPIDNPCLRL